MLRPLVRILFAGLWCMADCEGRLEDRPKYIKVEILPFDRCRIVKMLQILHREKLIVRYRVADKNFIQITNFLKHQRITGKEAETPSKIPPPEKHQGNNGETPEKHQGNIRDDGKGRERKGMERKTYSAKADYVSLPSNGTANHCQALTAHIKDSYKKLTGANLMLSRVDENTIKAMIGQYDHAQLMALWDMFVAKNWDWKNKDGRVIKRVPHDIRSFRDKISELLEDEDWKKRMKKYEAPESVAMEELVGRTFQK